MSKSDDILAMGKLLGAVIDAQYLSPELARLRWQEAHKEARLESEIQAIADLSADEIQRIAQACAEQPDGLKRLREIVCRYGREGVVRFLDENTPLFFDVDVLTACRLWPDSNRAEWERALETPIAPLIRARIRERDIEEMIASMSGILDNCAAALTDIMRENEAAERASRERNRDAVRGKRKRHIKTRGKG